jgi:hypothetical protein
MEVDSLSGEVITFVAIELNRDKENPDFFIHNGAVHHDASDLYDGNSYFYVGFTFQTGMTVVKLNAQTGVI